FFFQAEDGIRARNVTGVQTCALPIWPRPCDREKSEGRIRTARHQREREHPSRPPVLKGAKHGAILRLVTHSFRRGSNHRRAGTRSEERRVGKEGANRGVCTHSNNTDM